MRPATGALSVAVFAAVAACSDAVVGTNPMTPQGNADAGQSPSAGTCRACFEASSDNKFCGASGVCEKRSKAEENCKGAYVLMREDCEGKPAQKTTLPMD